MLKTMILFASIHIFMWLIIVQMNILYQFTHVCRPWYWLIEGMTSFPHLMTLNLSALLTRGPPTTQPWSSLLHSCYIQVHKSSFVSDAVGGAVGGQTPTAVNWSLKNAKYFGTDGNPMH